MKRNLKNSILFVGCVSTLGIWTLFSVFLFYPYETTSLEKLHWENDPGIIAFQKNNKPSEEQLLLLRLKDGKEQPLSGLWNVNFSDTGAVFVFGKYTPKKDSKELLRQKLFYIERGTQKIHDIDVSNTSGDIISVQENPRATYLVIHVKTKQSSVYCLLERITTFEKPECKQLTISGVTDALWNPKKDHELVIKTSNDGIVLLDPWEKEPHTLLGSKNSALRKELLTLFSQKYKSSVISFSGGERKMFHILNIIVIRDTYGSQKKFTWYHTPFSSHVAWLKDGNHLLIKEKGAIRILELSSKKIVTFMTFDPLNPAFVSFRNQAVDQKL